jgi:hypothetical protein
MNCNTAGKKGDNSDKWSFAVRGTSDIVHIINSAKKLLGFTSKSDEVYNNVASSSSGARIESTS